MSTAKYAALMSISLFIAGLGYRVQFYIADDFISLMSGVLLGALAGIVAMNATLIYFFDLD